jgi:hypothetical protein
VNDAVKLGLSGAAVVAIGRMAAAGRLRRNVLAGIRIPSTMHSDEAWRAGHVAAATALTVAGLGPIAAAALAAKTPGDHSGKLLSRIGTAWLLGWVGLATFQANQAARATGDR